jgi:hypothetical protein
MRIKEIMANIPDSINTKKGIDDYYNNAMKDINKKNSEIKKVTTKKSTKICKKVTTVGSFDNKEQPVIVSEFTKNINILKKSPVVVISKINVENLKIQDTIDNKVSQFTKYIEETAELVKSKKINKKGYKLIYNYDDEPSFSTNILVTARRINKMLISDRKEVFNKQHT